MKFWCRYWHTVGLGVAAIAGILLAIFWNDMSVLVRIHTLNFIAINLHQFEEYTWPGGMGIVLNKMQSSGKMGFATDAPIDRYPLNQFSAMFGNCVITYIFYVLPIFFSDVIWLGMMPILFGMVFQVVMHVIGANIVMGSFYNPGMLATLLGHVPIGIYYWIYLINNGLATTGNVIGGVVYLILFIAVFMIVTYKVMPDKNNSWPFSDAENERGRKVAKALFHRFFF